MEIKTEKTDTGGWSVAAEENYFFLKFRNYSVEHVISKSPRKMHLTHMVVTGLPRGSLLPSHGTCMWNQEVPVPLWALFGARAVLCDPISTASVCFFVLGC